MLVRDHMSTPVKTIYPDASMQDALNLMRKEKIRRLPVIDKRGQLVGMVTSADLDKASPSEATTLSVWEIRELISRVRVEKIMTRDVITIEEDTPIEEAARIMTDAKVSGLPVMKGGSLVGLITETDLFKIFLEMFGARYPGVRISVEVSRAPGTLLKISQEIFQLGGNIVSLGTYLGEDVETGQITMKIDGIEKERLVSAVTPHVLRIVDVRETH